MRPIAPPLHPVPTVLRRRASYALLALLAVSGPAANAGDWPQFLGPERTGVSPEPVSTNWPAEGPRVLWSRKVGAGFAGPVVADGRLVVHHRQGDDSVIECLPVSGPAPGVPGEALWTHRYATDYRDRFGFDPGPRATPCLAEGRVFAFGAEGTLTALDAGTGRRLWQVATAKEFGADPGFFGFACSPLVVDGLVLLNIGGRGGAGLVAFDAGTGAVRWKATDHEAGYASPVVARIAGESRALFFTREGLVVVDPRTGAVRGEHPWRSRQHASVNAATPLVLGSRVLLSASYDTGAVLLDLAGRSPRPVWSGDDRISSHYASLVPHADLVFGFHGRQETGATLRCLEAATGKVRWSRDGLGSGTVLIARNLLLVLTERGELLAAPATADAFQPMARAQVLGSGVRAIPALAGGRLYARDKERLVCLDLAP